MLSKSFKSGKCKTSLKLAVSRIKLLKNRKEIQVKQLRRELAQLLATGQEQTARIRVEHVIREEKTMAAYELIEIYCELIVVRLPIIESQKTCPIDLKEAITSVIFASPRCSDIPELMDARKHFVAKYGKDFVTSSLELRPDCGVNRMIVEKLSAKAPDIELKIKTLTAIAKEHDVKWDSNAFEKELQTPKEDMLNGPSSFTSANKMPREPLNVNFSPDASQKESASKDFKNDVLSNPTGFNSHANLRTSNHVIPPTQNESRASESKAGGSDVRDSYSSDETASLNQPTWRMEFKDAASAAQVAAESAERASMAARAAAELASRGNISRQNSNEPKGSFVKSSRNGRPYSVGNSNLKGEHSESIKNGYQGMNDKVHRLPGDELGEVISHSSRTYADEDGEFSTSHMDNMKNFDGDQESFYRTEHMGYKKTNDEPGFAEENVEVNYDRSASASSIGTFDNDTTWVPPSDEPQTGNHDRLDLNSPAKERIASYVNDQRVSNDYPGTVFDEYDPEPYEGRGKLLDSFSRKQDDQTSIFASNNNNVNSKNIFNDSGCDSQPIIVEKVPSTKFEDNRPLTFDESDGSFSDSEIENRGSFHNETVRSSSLLQEQRAFDSYSFPRQDSMPSSSSKTKPISRTEEKDQLEVSSSLGINDFEMSDEYASGGDLGLNFGRLTGGFRNRGYHHPPYTASSVINSSLSSKDTVESTIPSTEPFVSQLDKPLTRTRTADEERYNQDSTWKTYPSSSRMLRGSNLETGKAKEFDSEEHIQGSRDSKKPTTDNSEEDATGLSLKQFEYHENSRPYRGGDQNIAKQHDPSESTASNTSEVFNPAKSPTRSEVIDQKIYELKPRSNADKDLSSRMSRIELDSDGDGRWSESHVNMESRGNANANTNIKLSRRTKDFPLKARSNLPRLTGSYDVLNSETGSQSSLGNSAVEPISQTVDEARTFHRKQIHKSLKPSPSAEHIVEPMPVASIQKDKKSPGQDSDTIPVNVRNSMPSDSASGTTLREASLKKTSHIHPKLPDYDTLAAHFQSLRSNLR